MVRGWQWWAAVAVVALPIACGAPQAPDHPAPVDDLDIEPGGAVATAERQARAEEESSAPRQQPARRAAQPRRAVRRAGGGRIDIDVVGADLHNLFRLLADVGGVNIVVDDAVQGKVTLRLRRVPWRDVVDAVASLKELEVTDSGGILIIRRRD